MNLRLYLVLPALALSSVAAYADILYKCADASGRLEYTNLKNSAKKCAVLSGDQPISTFSAPKQALRSPSPNDFPRVDGDTQRGRDGDRRKILEQEFATEQQNLDKARKALLEVETTRQGDEKNYLKYVDRMQGIKDGIALHERNVEALRHELANLK
ncbi:MAG: DUF4124 domain-containing protein [Proteobacteria bacterium]|nr:DUF4124 domain-containing protein [Pseudomonadota bacterium]